MLSVNDSTVSGADRPINCSVYNLLLEAKAAMIGTVFLLLLSIESSKAQEDINIKIPSNGVSTQRIKNQLSSDVGSNQQIPNQLPSNIGSQQIKTQTFSHIGGIQQILNQVSSRGRQLTTGLFESGSCLPNWNAAATLENTNFEQDFELNIYTYTIFLSQYVFYLLCVKAVGLFINNQQYALPEQVTDALSFKLPIPICSSSQYEIKIKIWFDNQQGNERYDERIIGTITPPIPALDAFMHKVFHRTENATGILLDWKATFFKNDKILSCLKKVEFKSETNKKQIIRNTDLHKDVYLPFPCSEERLDITFYFKSYYDDLTKSFMLPPFSKLTQFVVINKKFFKKSETGINIFWRRALTIQQTEKCFEIITFKARNKTFWAKIDKGIAKRKQYTFISGTCENQTLSYKFSFKNGSLSGNLTIGEFPNLCPGPASFLSANNHQNTIIIASTSGVVMVAGVGCVALICWRRRRSEDNQIEDDHRIDQNPVYGIYEESPVYNTVEDTNDYYE